MNNLLILTGPTGIGKTEISLDIAEKFNCEIISADSMQIYKGMDIGTAKLNLCSTNIQHHLIDIVNPDEEFSVSMFQDKCKKTISDIQEKNKLPFIVGGTGLYINSIVYNLNFQNTSKDLEYRNYLESLAETNGLDSLYEQLVKTDKDLAETIDKNNKNRIIRALEILKSSKSKEVSRFREENSEYNLLYIGLNMERENLYKKINERVEQMIDNGLVQETKKLLDLGYSRDLNSFKAIGYREIISYLYNEITLDEAIELIKKNSRHYAKRQLTWFRRDKRIIWFDREDEDLEYKLMKLIGEKFGNI